MNNSLKKKQLGQFFTKEHYWLHPQISEFIKLIGKKTAYDPFVGNGDLLKAVNSFGFKKFIGLDIEPISKKWLYNDSLINIPIVNDALIITNPPYLTNYSAKRKKIYHLVSKYFDNCKYDDLYQLAIEKCLSNDTGIMIIPETFINSSFPKNRLVNLTILENNPFQDTENPVCVICFDNKIKSLDNINIYKNDILLGNLGYFEKLRMIPNNSIKLNFNEISGNIALRAVDSTDPSVSISFMRKDALNYDLNGIKHSSRLITIIDIPKNNGYGVDQLITESNHILNLYRDKTHDILLSPFKGNRRDGRRRRRLDYATARAIIEKAHQKAFQLSLV